MINCNVGQKKREVFSMKRPYVKLYGLVKIKGHLQTAETKILPRNTG